MTEDVETIQTEVIDLFSKPIKQASLFYTRYYLTEIENVTEVAVDHSFHTNRLYNGFFWYGIYSCAREVSNIAGMSELPRLDNRALTIEDLFTSSFPMSLGEYLDLIMEDDDMKRWTINIVDWHTNIDFMASGRRLAEEIIETAEERFNAFSEPMEFLDNCVKLFSMERLWSTNFGGGSWASLARSIMQYNDLTKTTYVDLCWSIEHNNGRWLDKLFLDKEEQEIIERLSSNRITFSYATMEDSMEILDTILDEKRESKFNITKRYAFEYDSKLRRYDRLLPE